MTDFERTVLAHGFSSVRAFHAMMAAVDLSTPEKIAAFKQWQMNDGSKAGLVALGMGESS